MRSIVELCSLEGRKALVTGGAGHVGKVVAATLAELGADIAILDKYPDAAGDLPEKLRKDERTCLVLRCDLTDESSVRESVRNSAEALGGIDILVHCAAHVAAVPNPGWAVPFEEQTVDAWDEALRVELTSAFILAQESRRFLEVTGHGSIILFGSIYGICGPDFKLYEGTPMTNPTAYGVSKGGILQLMRYLATTFAPRIRINCISPGGIWRNQHEAFVSRYTSRTPMGRMATEEDLKGAVAYFASDLSSYVTGHNLLVDGGWSVW